jgi:small subunit ribosomal protein S15
VTLSVQQTKETVQSFGKTKNDSGSSAVQVALLTKRLEYLNQHFSTHKHDHHSKQGLLKIVGRRKRLLKYLQRTNPKEYVEVIQKLGLRR